jgi:hypothetical protein
MGMCCSILSVNLFQDDTVKDFRTTHANVFLK